MISEAEINQIFEERFKDWANPTGWLKQQELDDRVKTFLTKVYPQFSNLSYNEGSLFDKVARKGILKDVSLKEAMDHGNVLSPREYSVLDFFLCLIDERKLILDGVKPNAHKTYFLEEMFKKLENKLSMPDAEWIKPFYWTSEGIGKVERQKVPPQLENRTIWAEIEKANRIRVYANLGKVEIIDNMRDRFSGSSGFDFVTCEIHGWDLQPSGIYIPYGKQRMDSKPFGEMPVRGDYGSFSPWSYSTTRRAFMCSQSKKDYALVCLNKNGENEDFPETVEGLVMQLAKECLQDEEKVNSNFSFRWFEKKDLNESLKDGWWQEEESPYRELNVFPKCFPDTTTMLHLTDGTGNGFEQLRKRISAGEFDIGLDDSKVYGLVTNQRRMYLLKPNGLELL